MCGYFVFSLNIALHCRESRKNGSKASSFRSFVRHLVECLYQGGGGVEVIGLLRRRDEV